MKIWLKRGLVGLVAIVLLAVVGAAIFLLTFDPNAYKGRLETMVHERYGRQLDIRGEISLSLFPRIGLAVRDISLSEPGSADVFTAIDSARVAVAVWPLISNRLVVDHIAVQGLRARVVRDSAGRFNFSDLIGTTPAQPGATPSPAPAEGATRAEQAEFQVDIAGLELKQGEVEVRDAVSGVDLTVRDLAVATGRVVFDQPFDVTLSGRLQGRSPVADVGFQGQALLGLDPKGSRYAAQKLQVQLDGNAAAFDKLAVVLRGDQLSYSREDRLLSVNGVDLQVRGDSAAQGLEGLDMRLTAPQLALDSQQSSLQLSKLGYRAKGRWNGQALDVALDAPALSITPGAAKGDSVVGTFKLDGEGRTLGVSLNLSGVGGQDGVVQLKEVKLDAALKEAGRVVALRATSPLSWELAGMQGGLSALKGDVRIEDAALPGGRFEFPFIGSTQLNLPKDTLDARIDAILDGSPLNINLKATRLAQPQLAFKVAAEKLDIDALFPAPAAAEAKATDKAKAADKAGEKADDKSASKPAAEQPAATPARIDFSFLKGLDITGNVTLGQLKVRQLQARQVSAALRVVDGALELSRLRASLYQGVLNGKITATSASALGAELAFSKVALGPLLQDLTGEPARFTGQGNLDLKLQAQGDTTRALTSSLNGGIKLALRDGAIRGFNIAQTLREASVVLRELRSGRLPPAFSGFDMARSTDFTALEAELAFRQGRGELTALDMQAPLLRVQRGQPALIDLVDERLDLGVQVTVVNTKTGQGGKELAVLEGVTVPLRVHGHLTAPGFEIQWGDIAGNLLKQGLQRGLLEAITGGGRQEGEAPADGQAPADQAPARQDPVRQLEGALKGLLGR